MHVAAMPARGQPAIPGMHTAHLDAHTHGALPKLQALQRLLHVLLQSGVKRKR